MKIRKLRNSNFDFWTLVTVFGYLTVFVLLIFPLFNIFKASFISNDTGKLSLSNYKEILDTYITNRS